MEWLKEERYYIQIYVDFRAVWYNIQTILGIGKVHGFWIKIDRTDNNLFWK